MAKKKDSNFYVKVIASVVILILVAIWILNYPRSSQITHKSVPVVDPTVQAETTYQEATLYYGKIGYELYPAVLKKNVPVQITVDLATVQGCLRMVEIPDFEVSKTIVEGDNVIEFTPNKIGEFTIKCAMNMGYGKFRVE